MDIRELSDLAHRFDLRNRVIQPDGVEYGFFVGQRVEENRPIATCLRDCGSILTVVDYGGVCRQCKLEGK